MEPTTPVVAASRDGRLFEFRGPAAAEVQPAALVRLTADDHVQLGQVEDIRSLAEGAIHGTGRVLGAFSQGAFDARRSRPFGAAHLEAVDADTIAVVQRSMGATLEIGALLLPEAPPARLLPHRFNRHTFWCGQSGSGKTYALGVVLEQLLLHTRLPMVVLDPNADFVRMADPVHETGAAVLHEIASREVRILRPGEDADALLVRFTDLSITSQGAVLHLDPLGDREEFNELLHLRETVGALGPEDIVPRLREKGSSAASALAARIENLRVTEWGVWAGGRTTATDILATRPDATVLDLGGFAYPDEALVVALAVLDRLWAERDSRRPLLIVIDEAHNFCAPDGHGPLRRAVRERLIQIAAEGRKFGLWLLLSTQRPSRIHPSILSQCDNLAVMKMASPVDLEMLATLFGFVPTALLTRAPGFRQGEALFAGGFVPAPSLVRMGERLTREGGADVTVPLR